MSINRTFKHILLTGGAGFIGSHLCEYLLLSFPGARVTVLDAFTYAGKMENLRSVMDNTRFRYVKGDIRNDKLIRHLMKKSDAVINCAAETNANRSTKSADNFMQANVTGTYELLKAALESSINLFLQISTYEVYGPYDGIGVGLNEGAPMKPGNLYAASKASADMLVHAFHIDHKLPAIITRCCENYGSRQYSEKFIPATIKKALKDEKIPVCGTGLQKREWIHVSDHCSALIRILKSGTPGQVYNIGTKTELADIFLVLFILKELEKPFSLISFVKGKKHNSRCLLNSSKIRRLGWRPEVNIYQGLKDTIKWYVNQVETTG